MLDKFDLGIFINGIALGFSELIACPAAYLLINRVGRRIIAYLCYAITLLCSLILLFLWDQDNRGQVQ